MVQSCHQWENYCYVVKKYFCNEYIAQYSITGSFETRILSLGVHSKSLSQGHPPNRCFNNCESIKNIRNVKIIKIHISKDIISQQPLVKLALNFFQKLPSREYYKKYISKIYIVDTLLYTGCDFHSSSHYHDSSLCKGWSLFTSKC